MAVPVLVQAQAHYDVDEDAHPAGDKHDGGVHLKVLVDDPLHGHVHQDARHHPDEQDGDGGAQHFGPETVYRKRQLKSSPVKNPNVDRSRILQNL